MRNHSLTLFYRLMEGQDRIGLDTKGAAHHRIVNYPSSPTSNGMRVLIIYA